MGGVEEKSRDDGGDEVRDVGSDEGRNDGSVEVKDTDTDEEIDRATALPALDRSFFRHPGSFVMHVSPCSRTGVDGVRVAGERVEGESGSIQSMRLFLSIRRRGGGSSKRVSMRGGRWTAADCIGS